MDLPSPKKLSKSHYYDCRYERNKSKKNIEKR